MLAAGRIASGQEVRSTCLSSCRSSAEVSSSTIRPATDAIPQRAISERSPIAYNRIEGVVVTGYEDGHDIALRFPAHALRCELHIEGL
jgi:hypothetical protein